MKLYPKKLEAWHTIGGIIIAASTIAGLAWANLAEPRIDKKIDVKLTPFMERVDRALEYNNCLHMASMSDEQLKNANKLYHDCQLSRGVSEHVTK